jgi:hypothetical protein
MDKRIEEIVTGFQRLLKANESSFIATVKEDKTDTIDVEDFNGTLYLDVRKITTQGKKGVVPMLKRGSYVIVSRISNSDELFLSMMTEIESVKIDVMDTIIINEGKNGGLILIEKLIEKINQLEDKLKTHQHSYTAPTGAAITGLSPDGILIFNNTVKAELENTKVKH